jgi:hypothetical protein
MKTLKTFFFKSPNRYYRLVVAFLVIDLLWIAADIIILIRQGR